MKKIILVLLITSALSGCISSLTAECGSGNEIQCQYLIDKCSEGNQEACKGVAIASRQRTFYSEHPEALAIKKQQEAAATANLAAMGQCLSAGGQWVGNYCNIPQQVNMNINVQ